MGESKVKASQKLAPSTAAHLHSEEQFADVNAFEEIKKNKLEAKMAAL